VAKAEPHKWAFKARFRSGAFGWRSQPAITRVKQAVAEIRRVAKKEPALAAEGAVLFLERVSPALERVDSSSGAIGSAVSHALWELVPLIANAPVDMKTREAWLERLFQAHQDDEIPYIEPLAEYWGELCVSREIASAWADRLIEITRRVLNPDIRSGFFHGTSACLSALHHAGRYDELIEILRGRTLGSYKLWAARALAAKGETEAALAYAEGCRSLSASDYEVDQVCEQILRSAGRLDEAYTRYGVRTGRGSTYLATFRSVAKKYPHKAPGEILQDLVRTTPGDEGKWFAAAKDAGLYKEALVLAGRTPCDPRTLARAARDYGEKQPGFALGAGLLALEWLLDGYGWDITSADAFSAYRATMAVAERHGKGAEVKERIRQLAARRLKTDTSGNDVARMLSQELGL
jgi:hypothetical protein